MIWQLIKRDLGWRWSPFYALVFGSLALYTSRNLSPGPGMLMGLMVPMFSVYAAVPGFASNSTLYEGALPIEGRDLWLSRVVALLAMLWLPILFIAVALPLGGDRHIPMSLPFEAGAVYTLVILAVKCFRIREFAGPAGLRFIGFVVGFVMSELAISDSMGIYTPSAGMVLAGCGLVSVGLFLKGWSTVPKSFQIAPIEVVSSSPPREASGPSRLIWSPVFRTFSNWQLWFGLFFVVSQLAFGSLVIGYVYSAIFLATSKDRGRWLLALPVSPRTLFVIMSGPWVVGTVLGWTIRIFVDREHPLALDVRIVELAAGLMFLYVLIFFFGFLGWRRLSRLKSWVRAIPFCLALGVPFALIVIDSAGSSLHHGIGVFDERFGRLSGVLPRNWWLLTVVLVLPLAATYLSAEKVFAEQEVGKRLTKDPPSR